MTNSIGIIAQDISTLDSQIVNWNTAPSILTANVKPNHNITLHNADHKEVGVLDFNGPQLEFTGDASASAQVFIHYMTQNFQSRLIEERQKIIDQIESLGFATEEQEATASIIVHYLKSSLPPR